MNTREKPRSPLRNIIMQRRLIPEREKNEKYLRNLLDHALTDHQVSVLAKGLKFQQLAGRMRLRYISHGNDKEPHPFHVKSNWIPPVQPSIALESYLEHVKLSISEIEITNPKHNLSRNEHKAVKELQNNTAINLKRVDKGSTTVILNKGDKIQEAQVELDNRDHYCPLENPMHGH